MGTSPEPSEPKRQWHCPDCGAGVEGGDSYACCCGCALPEEPSEPVSEEELTRWDANARECISSSPSSIRRLIADLRQARDKAQQHEEWRQQSDARVAELDDLLTECDSERIDRGEQIATLTRERDEARAEVDEMRSHFDKCDLDQFRESQRLKSASKKARAQLAEAQTRAEEMREMAHEAGEDAARARLAIEDVKRRHAVEVERLRSTVGDIAGRVCSCGGMGICPVCLARAAHSSGEP